MLDIEEISLFIISKLSHDLYQSKIQKGLVSALPTKCLIYSNYIGTYLRVE